MKKIIAKFPVIIAAFFVAVLVVMACAKPAYATKEKYKPKVYVCTTQKIFDKDFRFNKNLTYVEFCTGVVKNNKGDGYVVGHEDWYISYRYKNHPKKGTKVYSLFQLDSNGDLEALNRKDFVIKKDGTMKEVYKSY